LPLITEAMARSTTFGWMQLHPVSCARYVKVKKCLFRLYSMVPAIQPAAWIWRLRKLRSNKQFPEAESQAHDELFRIVRLLLTVLTFSAFSVGVSACSAVKSFDLQRAAALPNVYAGGLAVCAPPASSNTPAEISAAICRRCFR
jgi:hypothetical protein